MSNGSSNLINIDVILLVYLNLFKKFEMRSSFAKLILLFPDYKFNEIFHKWFLKIWFIRNVKIAVFEWNLMPFE